MALVVARTLVADSFRRVPDGEPLPDGGAVLVSLATWRAHEPALRARGAPVGVLLASNEHPDAIADAVDFLALVALEFPTFRDGRAYSCARLLRERYGYTGQLRAVGDVLLEQLHYMERVGFDAFEIDSDDPLADLAIAEGDFSVWFQPAADRRPAAAALRHVVRPDPDREA
jgi:uncharacterized protein (DUF934 family)